MEEVENGGVGQNFNPRPRSERRFFGGVMKVVRSWNARWDGRSK
jgi:hypothetical protein